MYIRSRFSGTASASGNTATTRVVARPSGAGSATDVRMIWLRHAAAALEDGRREGSSCTS